MKFITTWIQILSFTGILVTKVSIINIIYLDNMNDYWQKGDGMTLNTPMCEMMQ